MPTEWSDARTALAASLRAQRVALRLTQQDLADLAGVPRKTVSALESPSPEGTGFSWASLTRVLEALGMTVTAVPVTLPTLDDLLAENAEGGMMRGEDAPSVARRVRRPSRKRTAKADTGGPGHAP